MGALAAHQTKLTSPQYYWHLGKGWPAVVCLPLGDPAPPRKPLLAEASVSSAHFRRGPRRSCPPCSVSSAFSPPALPLWLPLCGVGRSWSSVSSYSATALPPPPKVRIHRRLVPQSLGPPGQEGFLPSSFPPTTRGRNLAFSLLEGLKAERAPLKLEGRAPLFPALGVQIAPQRSSELANGFC